MARDSDAGDPAGETAAKGGSTSRKRNRYDLPAGVVALRQYSDGYRYYITITDLVRELGYKAGEEALFIRFDPAEANRPAALRCEHVPNPGDEDDHNPAVQSIIDHRSSYRVTLPPQELGEYGAGIDLDDYDTDDPFLFEPIPVPSADGFYLNLLGHVSEVFRYDERHTTPIPSSLIEEAATDSGVPEDDLHDLLDMVAKTLGERTFDAAGFPLREIEPTVVAVDGQRLAVYYAPSPDDRSVFRELLEGLYDAPPEVAAAVWQLHQTYATQLATQLADSESETELPGDHPLQNPGTEGIVIPLEPAADARANESSTGRTAATASQADAAQEGGAVRGWVPPVESNLVTLAGQSTGVPVADLDAALTTVTRELTHDRLQEADIVSEWESVTVPFTPDTETPAGYSAVRVYFVTENGLADLAEAELGLSGEQAAACQQIHTKQAERILATRDGVDPKFRRFRSEYDAVLVPVDPDQATNS